MLDRGALFAFLHNCLMINGRYRISSPTTPGLYRPTVSSISYMGDETGNPFLWLVTKLFNLARRTSYAQVKHTTRYTFPTRNAGVSCLESHKFDWGFAHKIKMFLILKFHTLKMRIPFCIYRDIIICHFNFNHKL